MHAFTHYEHLARLFDYPQRDYPSWVLANYELLKGNYIVAAAHIEAFAQVLPTQGEDFNQEALDEVQEVFTRSFDVQSITTLGVGYVLFGDDYKRGELLANLGREQAIIGMSCGTELPDHLPNVLRLLARWENKELVGELVTEILHPALTMMIEEFDAHRMAAREQLHRKFFKTLIVTSAERGTMYCDALQAVLEVLKVDFKLGDYKPEVRKNDFLKNIERELEIEAEEDRPMTSEVSV